MNTIIIERSNINVEAAKRLLDAWMTNGECDIVFRIRPRQSRQTANSHHFTTNTPITNEHNG